VFISTHAHMIQTHTHNIHNTYTLYIYDTYIAMVSENNLLLLNYEMLKHKFNLWLNTQNK